MQDLEPETVCEAVAKGAELLESGFVPLLT
jgi:hypothetical protein